MATARELTPDDAPELTALYEEYDWWADREIETVRAAPAEIDLAIGIDDDGALIAAARVITDFTYYTAVYDVIAARDRRGEGLDESEQSGDDGPRYEQKPEHCNLVVQRIFPDHLCWAGSLTSTYYL